MSQEAKRDAFAAIAEPNRRRIIDLLAKKPLTLNAIAEEFHISRPAVSQHIKVLRECGIVVIERLGRERYCKIQPQKLIPAFVWLEKHNKEWQTRIDAFEKYIDQLKSKKAQL